MTAKSKYIVLFITSMVLTALLVLGVLFNSQYSAPSTGYRLGKVGKLSTKGWFSTHEGQMQVIGNTYQVWEFSCHDDSLATAIADCDTQTIKLWYEQQIVTFPWEGQTTYQIVGVEKLQ